MYFVEVISNACVFAGALSPVLGGRAFGVFHAQRLKAQLRATASTFYHVQLVSAIAAAAVRTGEK
jgi:hypothetical protein